MPQSEKKKKIKIVLLLSASSGQCATDSQHNIITAIIFPAKQSVSGRTSTYNINTIKQHTINKNTIKLLSLFSDLKSCFVLYEDKQTT